MDFTQHGLLDELLSPERDTNWTNFPTGENDFFSNGWMFESFDHESQVFFTSPNPNPNPNPNPPFLGVTSPTDLNELYPFFDGFTEPPELDSSSYHYNHGTTHSSMVEVGDYGFVGLTNDLHSLEETINCCKVEIQMESTVDNITQSNIVLCGEKKNRVKKAERQPSKNLMAERRRRKRVNDRLLMLRSIVPKISKECFHEQMDRTSILGDTIGYMKELLEKVKTLQEEDDTQASMDQGNLMDSCKELKPNEPLVRNSPKFNVERTNTETRIEIRCAAKPGLLLSTINSLESLGINVQQCVISCFNDFSMQGSCSEGLEQQMVISSEDIKQALYRNAGYGGLCL
ncbi:unnamed protein product [Camellia sinensis]